MAFVIVSLASRGYTPSCGSLQHLPSSLVPMADHSSTVGPLPSLTHAIGPIAQLG